jgi:enoyl-CoA hydratase
MSTVQLQVSDGVATVTLDDPDRRNALSLEMVERLNSIFDEIEAGDVGAVVVTGAPPAFCAGASLDHLAGAGDDGDRARGMRDIYEGFLRVARSPLPTIAAVNGAAVGAGMNLALVCDLRLAARSARFDSRFLQLGLHPGGGHTWMLDRVLGPQGAAALALFGEVIDGAGAARCGLVWRCVEDDALLTEANAIAARVAGAPRALARALKQTLAGIGTAVGHDEAVSTELDVQLWSMAQPEFRERLEAMQRRISKN